LIDWTQEIQVIERFIRAVTKPFNGAFTFVGDQKITIWDAQVFDLQDFGYEHVQPGVVAAVFENGKFLVKCFGGLLLVNSYDTGIEINPGQKFGNNGLIIKQFERNSLGFFDVVNHHQ
jgi:methionyl-tRNA formyltransferase